MTKIDHFFATAEWLEIFPRTGLQALASLGSDQCLLFLQGDVTHDFYRGFRFESLWVNCPDFMETVQEAWNRPVNTQDSIMRLHVKLMRTAKALKMWRRKNFCDWKVRWAVLNITLLNLEKAQEERSLTHEEVSFKKYLKSKALGLVAVQKSRARQHSRLTWIRKGDANTKFFHPHANARKKKTFIPTLATQAGTITLQEEKSKLVHAHFSQIMGSPIPRTKVLNWQELGYSHHNLEDLDAPFTQQEIGSVIKEMPSEKAPGPDGFIGLFYKRCWDIIKDDLTEAIASFYSHRTAKLNLVNEANVVLLPKNQMAATILDYRPISLINSVAKIITKLLTNRLAPHLNELVSHSQNAFIKKRCIHDNFLYAQRVIQLLHRKKKLAFFIKLDISKAFDSIGWSFLLEVMQALGFSTKWRD